MHRFLKGALVADPRKSGRRPSSYEFDISNPGGAPNRTTKAKVLTWLTWFTLSLMVIELAMSGVPALDITGIVMGLVGVAIIGRVAWILIVRRGVFTWWPLARRPARLLAKGEGERAEAVFQQALRRAQQFAPLDYRRAMMVGELGAFAACQGRAEEGRALLEETLHILEKCAGTMPMPYFVALNNYAVFFIDTKDFLSAQKILEKAVDLSPVVKKKGTDLAVGLTAQELELFLHRNLAYLFIEMNELAEAKEHLEDMECLFENLRTTRKKHYHDHCVSVSAYFKYATGAFADAWSECQKGRDPTYVLYLRLQAKIHLVQQDFVEAEDRIRKLLSTEGKKGTLHRPRLLDPKLDLAESLFGQGRSEEALASFQEICAIIKEFDVPRDPRWRRTLTIWLKRAKDMGRGEALAHLEEELQSTREDTGITVLDRFRVRPPE